MRAFQTVFVMLLSFSATIHALPIDGGETEIANEAPNKCQKGSSVGQRRSIEDVVGGGGVYGCSF